MTEEVTRKVRKVEEKTKNKTVFWGYAFVLFFLTLFLGIKVFIPIYQDYIKVKEPVKRIQVETDYYTTHQDLSGKTGYVKVNIYRKVNIYTNSGMEISLFQSEDQVKSLEDIKAITYLPELDKSLFIVIILLALVLTLFLKQNTKTRMYISMLSSSFFLASFFVIVFFLDSNLVVLSLN